LYSWTAKKTNEWVLNRAGVKEGTVRHCQSKEASILWSHAHTIHEETRERDSARNNARCWQARKTTVRMDNINTWIGLSVEESIRRTEDGNKWRKCIHGVANPQIEDS